MDIRTAPDAPYPGGMSTSPSQSGKSAEQPREGASALDFDDPLTLCSSDDTDRGWGEGSSGPGNGGGAADLARFLDEKPPHHL